MNPKNSPWYKPAQARIQDRALYFRWAAIAKHLTTTPVITEHSGILSIQKCCYIAKSTAKMRLKSHLDWCWYTPKTLAQAIDSNTIEAYYEIMLTDVRSDPNVWKDRDFELDLKSFYAQRAGRANII
jgi:hypothetical protein